LASAYVFIIFIYSISGWANFGLIGTPNIEYLKNVVWLGLGYLLIRVFNLYHINSVIRLSSHKLYTSLLRIFATCPLPNLFEQIPINTVSDALSWKYEQIDTKGWKNLDATLDNLSILWAIAVVITINANPFIVIAITITAGIVIGRLRVFNKFLRGLMINGKLRVSTLRLRFEDQIREGRLL
jgi:hypothetical protein